MNKYVRKIDDLPISEDRKSAMKMCDKEMVAPCLYPYKSPKETLKAMRNDPNCLFYKKRGDRDESNDL